MQQLQTLRDGRRGEYLNRKTVKGRWKWCRSCEGEVKSFLRRLLVKPKS